MNNAHYYSTASGKQNNSYLSNPIWVGDYLRQFYPKTIAREVCTTKMPGSVIGKGSSSRYIFTKAPKGDIHKYVDGQPLQASKLHATQSEMYLDRGYYQNLHKSPGDMYLNPQYKQLAQEYADNCAKELAVKIDTEILEYLPTQIHKCNQGKNAGKHYGAYNLGTIGAPIKINPNNIYENVSKLDQVLMEADLGSTDGKPYLIMPSQAMHHMRLSPTSVSAYNSGMAMSSLISGKVAEETDIIKYQFSNLMPSYTDPVTGDKCYKIVAGYKEATYFHVAVDEKDIDLKSTEHFGVFDRMLMMFGMHTIYPEKLAMMYCTFEKFEN